MVAAEPIVDSPRLLIVDTALHGSFMN